MAASSHVPSLQHHKATGQAFVRLQRSAKPIYLGKFGTAEALSRYHRTLAEWHSGQPFPAVSADEITVAELAARFWEHAKTYYRYPDGTATPELASFKPAIQSMLDLYADLPCSQFGPKALKAVRQHMIDVKQWCRRQVNKQVGRIRLVFRWGTEEECVPAGVLHALRAVQGLQQGRSAAPERPPVQPAPDAVIDAVRPFLSPTLWDMLQVQLLSGGRPQDVAQLRPSYIDRSGEVWVAQIPQHKTAWRGHAHKLLLGPQAQAIVAPYLLRRPADQPVFSPREAAEQSRAARTASRVTPASSGNRPGTNVKAAPQRQPGQEFDVPAYCRAISRACDRAFPLPSELARLPGSETGGETMAAWKLRLGPDEWARVEQWRRDHRFTPNQLRHTAATRLRRQFGLDMAQTFLGHRIGSQISELYAEADLEKAMRAAKQVG